MALKMEAKGGDVGDVWDDGSYDGIRKVYVGKGQDCIAFVKFEYVNDSQVVVGDEHGKETTLGVDEFEVDEDDYIVYAECYHAIVNDDVIINAIIFKTFKGKTSQQFGTVTGIKFVLQGVQDKKIIGFHGLAGENLNSLGAYFAPLTTSAPSSTPARKVPALGSDEGTEWDDGAYQGVKKVYVGQGQDGVSAVKFEYANGSQVVIGDERGKPTLLGFEEFDIDYPSEYIIAVDGTYDKIFGSDSAVITMLKFKTNKKTSNPFGLEAGIPFEIKEEDKKIIGFHGSASNNLNSIGAYFVLLASSSTISTPVVPPKKLEAKGGETGAVWDDAHHDNVKKVYVGQGEDGLSAIKFEYTNGSQVVIGDEHGKPTMLAYEEFTLESDEYITSVEGTYDKIFGTDSAIMTMLIFKTSKNNTYGPYGLEGSVPFIFKEEGYKISGFHGRASDVIHAIGVYLAPLGSIPLTPAKPTKKLEAVGGTGGTSWDDGVFDGVRKVFVGQSGDGIGAVKFVYDKGNEVVIGNDHGKTTMLGYEQFTLESDEYITSVEGTYDKIFGTDSAIMTMLIFKTSKNNTYGPYGLEGSVPFVFKEEGYKISGFHGRASDVIHAIGVYLAPLGSIPLTPAKPN
ncbi:unnamed protein product [Cochlearia groenlandica]